MAVLSIERERDRERDRARQTERGRERERERERERKRERERFILYRTFYMVSNVSVVEWVYNKFFHPTQSLPCNSTNC